MGLLLLWCSVHAAGHLLSCTGTHRYIHALILIIHILLRKHCAQLCVCVCVSRERSRQCVSWLCSTSGTSSPSTWNWMRLCLDPEPEFLLLSYRCCWYYRYTHAAAVFSPSSSHAVPLIHTQAACTNIHDWCRVREVGKWQQMGKEEHRGYRELLTFFFFFLAKRSHRK